MVIKIRDLKKAFHERTVIDGISIDVTKGDLIAIIGPSGCGKSTLLRCINGLETSDGGCIEVFGTELKSPNEIGQNEFTKRALTVRQKVGMVFQSFNLFPHLTIMENLMMRLSVAK
jgi:polar amino acid transport system ATP-binding protein